MLAAALYWIYEAIRAASAGSTGWAERNGHQVFHTEQVLHLDPERWLNRIIDRLPVLAVPACYVYAVLYMVITPGVLVWAYRRHPDAYRRHRTTLVIVTFAALVGFRWFPTAPPRLLIGGRFVDTMDLYHSWGWWGTSTSAPAGTGALANAYAAMPSLHVAWAVWSAATVCLLVRRPAVRAAAIAYPVITALVVLGTANHYLFDVLAGAFIWLLAHLAVAAAQSVRRRARDRQPARPADASDARLHEPLTSEDGAKQR
jgi:hypothetical protein